MHGRTFPWRAPSLTAFQIIVVEMLLRRTQAIQVAALWPSFIETYGEPEDIAGASDLELLDILRPLGLGHQRVQALKEMSLFTIGHLNGRIPPDAVQLQRVPHVGMYIAAACMCFGFGYPVPVVDANVMRIVSRYVGLPPSKDNRRATQVWCLAAMLLPTNDHRAHNYALLDLGASVCRSTRPKCTQCPIQEHCREAAIAHSTTA